MEGDRLRVEGSMGGVRVFVCLEDRMLMLKQLVHLGDAKVPACDGALELRELRLQIVRLFRHRMQLGFKAGRGLQGARAQRRILMSQLVRIRCSLRITERRLHLCGSSGERGRCVGSLAEGRGACGGK